MSLNLNTVDPNLFKTFKIKPCKYGKVIYESKLCYIYLINETIVKHESDKYFS